MDEQVNCPVCQGNNQAKCKQYSDSFDGKSFDCERCGKYSVVGSVLDNNNIFRGEAMSDVQRVCMSQLIRMGQSQSKLPFINSDWFRGFKETARLSSPIEQADKLIELIGDHVSAKGAALKSLPQSGYGEVGFFDREAFVILFKELFDNKLILGELLPDTQSGVRHPTSLNLTLLGWAKYEALRSGINSGNYGFLAMKFGDERLEYFASEHIKPYVSEKLGYRVIDIRDVSKAGIIDNLMREQIRDSAFVIADLTHDNLGAYWEAGYAEGLGKPVIYICEKEKFEKTKTHFDTNHCTTVMWSSESPENFQKELVATIRRSLGLF